MSFSDFHRLYSGSMRTKNVQGAIVNPIGQLKTLLKLIAKGRLQEASIAMIPKENKRVWRKKFFSPLGRHFICLCPWEAAYLYMVASKAKYGILEIGRFNGGSTFLLKAACEPTVKIHSIDIAPQDDNNLIDKLNHYLSTENVHLHVCDSRETTLHNDIEYDVLWIDGDHSFDGCLSDLRTFFPKLKSNGHLLLHDAYEGSEVLDAIIAFQAETTELMPINNIYKTSFYYQDPHGSIAHFRKT